MLRFIILVTLLSCEQNIPPKNSMDASSLDINSNQEFCNYPEFNCCIDTVEHQSCANGIGICLNDKQILICKLCGFPKMPCCSKKDTECFTGSCSDSGSCEINDASIGQ